MKCKFDVSSNLGNGASVATKGKHIATWKEMKSVVATDSHRFNKSITTNLKPVARFHSFGKIGAIGQKLAVYFGR